MSKLPNYKGNLAYLSQGSKRHDSSRDFEANGSHDVISPGNEDKFGVKIGHIVGTIHTTELFKFKRLIFRVTRGNVLIQSEDMKQKNSEKLPQEMLRSTFLLTFQEGQTMREKLERISASFGVRVYNYPEKNAQQVVEDLDKKVTETRKLLKDSNSQLRKYLIQLNDLEAKRRMGGNSPFYGVSTLPMYKMFVMIEAEIYRNMNCLKTIENGSVMYGFIWSKYRSRGILAELQSKGLYLAEVQFHDVMDHAFETPTYFKTNKFTDQFQIIVDTYGVPNYKEVNPAVFTIISFPFLFGVMFGDVGHGSLLFIIASLICLFGHKLPALSGLYNTRYLLLLMGFFSVFSGFIYNDFMSIPLELWDSCYVNQGDIAVIKPDCVYPFGIDPKWYMGHNELVFINSLKMKLSVIFGVTQMLIGIFLKSLNAVHNNDFLEYLFEFWPQFILMWCWFGYMGILIITKWLTPFPDTSIAPSIVAHMIDMFLKFGEIERQPILSDKEGGESINRFLLLVSLLCIPLMLIVRPLHSFLTRNKPKEKDSRLFGVDSIMHSATMRKHQKDGYHQFEDEEELENNVPDKDEIDKEIHREEEKLQFELFVRAHTKNNLQNEEPEEADGELENEFVKRRKTATLLEERNRDDQAMHELKQVLKIENATHGLEEVVVHQLIETIEFVLGTVSNTASYLRLWALSLAHSQLAAVFFEKTLELGLYMGSSIALFFIQQGFWVATLGVLMSMDAMECFLHTLRLHWVEFQNKFYKGTGVKFTPLSFREVVIKE